MSTTARLNSKLPLRPIWIALVNTCVPLSNWTLSRPLWLASFRACKRAHASPSTVDKVASCLWVKSATKLSTHDLENWLPLLLPDFNKKATSTLHFTQSMRDFSYLPVVGGAELWFSSCFRWWTTNQSVFASYAIRPTWIGKLGPSFQTTLFRWCYMLQKKSVAILPTVARSSFLHIANTLYASRPY
jgi:hypothetical protein